jgi:hypothetical protein
MLAYLKTAATRYNSGSGFIVPLLQHPAEVGWVIFHHVTCFLGDVGQ